MRGYSYEITELIAHPVYVNRKLESQARENNATNCYVSTRKDMKAEDQTKYSRCEVFP